jgi:Ca2+-binding EF-hand superfamily protein
MATKSELKDKRKGNIGEIARQTLTKEMTVELEETFAMMADASGKMPYQKLPLALKALGMAMNESNEIANSQQDDITVDRFLQIVTDCMRHPNWAANEMNESFALFDKDNNGLIEPSELRRVFTKLGEKLTETELEDQLREFDIDGDLQVNNKKTCKVCTLHSPEYGCSALFRW